MKKVFTLIALTAVLVISGCGEKFNAPFIDTVETLQLRPQMTREEVAELCGDPLYVGFGDGEITVWVYEVRALNVGGSSSLSDQASSAAAARLRISEGSGLVKEGSERDHGAVIPHAMFLFFKEDSLQFWSTEDVIEIEGFFRYAVFPALGIEWNTFESN